MFHTMQSLLIPYCWKERVETGTEESDAVKGHERPPHAEVTPTQ